MCKEEMKKLIGKMLFKIVKFEHILYCFTQCRIELPLHKSYYKWRRKNYEHYVDTTGKYTHNWI